MLRRLLLALAIIALAGPWSLARWATQAAPLDFDVDGGHFYTQAAGDRVGEGGFAVRNDGDARFWQTLQDYGGPQTVGYPISHRFLMAGLVSQAFQKVILQWNPATRSAAFLNVFDLLHDAGKDDLLAQQKMTPNPIALDERGFTFDQIRTGRLALLKSSPAFEALYQENSDPLLFYGLPTSRAQDMGNAVVMRFQRVVMQQWKIDVPWAKAGEIVIANGGDLAKETGLLPAEAIVPVSATTPLALPAPVVATSTPTVAVPAGTPTPSVARSATPTVPSDSGVPIPANDQEAILLVNPSVVGSRKPGATATLQVTVTFRDGRPFKGAGVGVIASFDDYDDVFFMDKTDVNGKTSHPLPIHSTVSAGSQVKLKVQAFFPYYGGTTRTVAVVE